MNMEQSVPKRRHIKSRRRVITQKKAYNDIIYLTSIGLTPGGSSTHLHTIHRTKQSTQNNT